MSTPHLVRTASQPRSSTLSPAKLVDKRPICASGSIHLLRLQSTEPLSYFPGQWVDCHLPERAQARVGGFTLVSDARDQSMLELAVKYVPQSRSTRWVIDESQIGDVFKLRIGGDFIYPPTLRRFLDSEIPIKSTIENLIQENLQSSERDHDTVVFVAAGTGFNPILSILRSLPTNISSFPSPLSIRLLLSCKSSDLYAIDILSKLSCIDPKDITIFLTGEDDPVFVPFYASKEAPSLSIKPITSSTTPFKVIHRRLTSSDLFETIKSAIPYIDDESCWQRTLVYLCGPPELSDSLLQHLSNPSFTKFSIPQQNIILERWYDPKSYKTDKENTS